MPSPNNSSTVSIARLSTAWQENVLRLLLSISERVAALNSLDDILKLLVEVTAQELDADRASLFLHDAATGELYSRIALGGLPREIRIMSNTGIAGAVFAGGEPLMIHDAYADKRFNAKVDEQTGYRTKNILCVPVRTVRGEVIGVAQAINKRRGRFTKRDLDLMTAITTQAALGLESMSMVERVKKLRAQELEFLEVVSDMTSDIKIDSLLQKVMAEATRMLNAERSTLFLNDEKTHELWSQVGQGLGAMQIRLPNHVGIAGAVFTSGKTINIPHAYADLRFNPAFDRKSGFFTRSILCVPIVNQKGKIIGVTQVLNKKNGSFTAEDESRLKAFTAQISISLENASLFADVQNMKNYNEGILLSMTNAVLTFDEDGRLKTCNKAGSKIFGQAESALVGISAQDLFCSPNDWVIGKIERVLESKQNDVSIDATLSFGTEPVSVNLTAMPLLSVDQKSMGFMLMIEDISSEKRMKSTMSRYIDPSIADRLLEAGSGFLDGQNIHATILFSDIRGFTTLTEQLGPQGTVNLLNEYFEIMVECITREGGILDKFIGDAIMAGFGVPQPLGDNEDRAMRAALAMIRELDQWNQQRERDGKLPVNIGIGLNSDNIVSGNIGSKKRMDFTMIGDGVNLAARLESACKQYHARLLISELTRARLKGTYRMREVDRVVVKGKTEPIAVYEVLDYHDEASFPNLMESLSIFRDGLVKYRAMKWEPAIESFRKCLELHPADALAQTYIDRCELLRSSPPTLAGKAWDGVWVMQDK